MDGGKLFGWRVCCFWGANMDGSLISPPKLKILMGSKKIISFSSIKISSHCHCCTCFPPENVSVKWSNQKEGKKKTKGLIKAAHKKVYAKE